MRRLRHVIYSLLTLATLLPTMARSDAPMRALDSQNGPTDQRINLVWIPDSYSADRIPEFMQNATAQKDAVYNGDVFKEYRSCFNAFAIPEVWTRAGTGSIYTPADNEKIFSLVEAQLPEYNVIFVIRPGYDYTHCTAFFTNVPTHVPNIIVHELRH